MDQQIKDVIDATEGSFLRFIVLAGLGLIFTLAAIIEVATA